MKLALMQPYFFPYLGYFDLINSVDKWIVFDTAQYIKRGWIHRNRILHPKNGCQYIIVPVKKHSYRTRINEIIIDNEQNWRRKIIRKLQRYKKNAPYFDQVIDLVEESFAIEEKNISRLNTAILSRVCKYLGIRFNYTYLSEMNIKIGHLEGPGDWGLRVSEKMDAKEYVNLSGGKHLFNECKFKQKNIKLTIKHQLCFTYSCVGYEFMPNLSILDLLMWNKPETIKLYLDNNK